MKFLFCVVLLAFGAVGKAQQDDAFPDYWQGDYDDSSYNYNDDANTILKSAETSKQVDTETQDGQVTSNAPDDKPVDAMEDYQIEDNRSNSGEKKQVQENIDTGAVADSILTESTERENKKELAVLPLELPQETEPPVQINEDKDDILYEDMWHGMHIDELAPLPVPASEEKKDILEETQKILNEDTDNFDDQQVEESVKEESQEQNEQPDLDKIIEETNKRLEEIDDSFEPNDYGNSDEQLQEKSEEDTFSENNDEVEEDTPVKVYADLNADLDKLFETLDKLSDNNFNEAEGNVEEGSDIDNAYVDNVQDYEEKYDKPYKEDAVLSWRNAEADATEPNDETVDENKEVPEEEQVLVEQDDDIDYYENVDDSNLSEIFGDNAKDEAQNENDEQELVEANKNDETEQTDVSGEKKESVDAPLENNDGAKEADYVDNFDESLDSESNADDEIDSVIQQIFSEDIKEPQAYGNDALVDEKQPKNEDAVEFESLEVNNTNIEENIEQKTVMVDDLSSAELSDLMTQFVVAHREDLDVNSETFSTHVAPIHVTLSVDEPTIIESPNYPDFYPTGDVIDWIFEGPGTGIEMNITDFAVNGALGHYLLVKPGGLDESGQDGLVFSYHLNSERKYRFSDVNRMFVRFNSMNGWPFFKGFSFSVKLMWPLPTLAEEMPEPEAVLNPPRDTLTLNLAGLTLPQFNAVKDEFVELIAEMAKAYIQDNDIDRGLNTTFEVTQITRTAICNIRWPNYETCVEVSFGVPLQYEEENVEHTLNEEDLDKMWTKYIVKEEFAARLRELGITEYAIPNDRTVLMVWLVIAAGVLISMAMLAFALWRFSCFEDYTRMPVYGDTDSVQNEKRHLDLYPTPHQTLPPLYSQNDYKWADDKYDDSTRVDMGGFANKSYVRDELFDLDSDEDVINTRDRKGLVNPKGYCDV